MNPTRTVVSLALAALCAHACAAPIDPRLPSAAGPSELHFQLSARDARGRTAPLEGIARRPEFVLSSARPLSPVELVLFTGEPDADLLEDLADLPLRAANARRIVPSYALQAGSVLRLAPRIALPKDAVFTLALPGTARAAGGAALGAGGPAFVAQLRTAGDASAGAAWSMSFPAANQREVPVNVESAFVGLDGEVEAESSLEDAVWLEEPDGSAVPAAAERVDCEGVDARAITCARLRVGGGLAAATRYVLRSGRALRDARGAPVEPLAAAFETASSADRRPPGFEPVGCLPDELAAEFGCLAAGDTWVELTLRSDESVRVAVRASGPNTASAIRAPRDPGALPDCEAAPASDAHAARADGGLPSDPSDAARRDRSCDGGSPRAEADAHELRSSAQLAAAGDATLRVNGFEPDSRFALTLIATDLAGNFSEVQVTGATVAQLATLSITEVLADPEGADAHQEYVEIWNFGRDPVELRGISLSDAAGKPSVVASSVALEPGARALLVSEGFESEVQPSAAPVVPAGVRLVRVGASLTKSGIANTGEALYLRDAAGHRLSAVPARATAAGFCLQRAHSGPQGGAAEDFSEARCSPGQ